MMAIGDVLTKDQATKAILGSTTMIWCYLISIPLFKREMKTHQWIGILLISVGGFVKVSIIVPGLFPNYVIHDYCTGEDESLSMVSNSKTNLGIGYCLYTAGYLLWSCLFLYQEHIMKKYNIPPVRIAAWEGLMSLTIQGLIMIPFYHIKSTSKSL